MRETVKEVVCDADVEALAAALDDLGIEPDRVITVMMVHGHTIGALTPVTDRYRVLYRAPVTGL